VPLSLHASSGYLFELGQSSAVNWPPSPRFAPPEEERSLGHLDGVQSRRRQAGRSATAFLSGATRPREVTHRATGLWAGNGSTRLGLTPAGASAMARTLPGRRHGARFTKS